MYPIQEPLRSGMLPVSELHTIYWEESGNPAGIPVIFLHGGPGAGSSPACRGFFNPEKYRVIIIDQRGSGKSTPYAETRENTTWDLVEDIEKVRKMLGWYSAAHGEAPFLSPMPKPIPTVYAA